MNNETKQVGNEYAYRGITMNGFLAIAILVAMIVAGAFYLSTLGDAYSFLKLLPALMFWIACAICVPGFTLLEPKEMYAFLLFGKYKGVVKRDGFFWVNPFLTKRKVSLRALNLDVDPIKVNDKMGNPIMIGMVLVWRVKDSYRALFEIEIGSSPNKSARMNAFQRFIFIQSDAALREVAGRYAYDNNENREEMITLRDGGDEIKMDLMNELNERLSMSGLEVIEARINYLAYAPEIAAVMLRRQQASAIISARELIVEGAVGMVQRALEKLETEEIIDLDPDKKAAMISNLLVVLCSDNNAQPVLNTGTLYN